MNNYMVSQPPGRTSRFMRALMLGALAGAAISLLDRTTRRSVMDNSMRYMNDMRSIVAHPDSALNQLKDMSSRLRTTIEQISQDVAFISAKMEEMKEIPPQVAHMVKETKDAFVTDGEVHHAQNLQTH
ncbi:YtxH domain-containing protein [Peribacillus sp. SCS-155]|uniref:YtxH domain-containing protein n=1 Tax=Peribacillus sedimenti TaxID=3115297 RepID=UPI0039069CE9